MSEVTSVNGLTGAVVLTAADVEAVPESAAGAASGVATLDAGGRLPEAQLSSSVVTGKLKELGEVSGKVKLNLGEGRYFTATLTGATEFEIEGGVTGVAIPFVLFVTQDATGGRAWSIKGIEWIGSYTGSEPSFLTTAKITYEVSLTLLGTSTLRGSAGLSGPEGSRGEKGERGEAGAKGERGERGETGAAGDEAENQLGIWLPVAGRSVLPEKEKAIGTAYRAIFSLIVLPRKAELNVIRVWNAKTVNGEHNVAIYSAEASGGEYERLWESGAVKAEGELSWQKLEPKLAKSEAARRLFLAIMNSGTTHTFGVNAEAAGSTSGATLPELPRLCGAHTFGGLAFPSRLKESQLEASGLALSLYGSAK